MNKLKSWKILLVALLFALITGCTASNPTVDGATTIGTVHGVQINQNHVDDVLQKTIDMFIAKSSQLGRPLTANETRSLLRTCGDDARLHPVGGYSQGFPAPGGQTLVWMQGKGCMFK